MNYLKKFFIMFASAFNDIKDHDLTYHKKNNTMNVFIYSSV